MKNQILISTVAVLALAAPLDSTPAQAAAGDHHHSP